MAAVTQTVPNFLGGVSKQTDEKKQPGQLRECLNAYPDPTFGLMKRPGFKFIDTIYTPATGINPELKDAKWFFIKRDNLETYIGCILDTTNPDGSASIHALAPIRIWNKDGTECTVTFESSPDAKLYLDTTRDNYDVLTVQDTSIITNKTKEVTTKAVPSGYVSNSKGTVRLKIVGYSIKYEINLKVGSTDYPVSFTTINAEDLTAPNSTTNPSQQTYNTAERILDELKTALDALSISGHTLTVTKLDASLELELKSTGSGTPNVAFELTTTDSQAGMYMDSFSEQVRTQADLPAESTDGRLAKVVNLGGASDTFWLKFFPDVGTSGIGNWEETVDPTVSVGMDAATLPHELYNSDRDIFVFRQPKQADGTTPAWKDRVVGDATTNSDPSFVGYTIQQAFYHNNRLGFLTEDNISMSKSNDFFNFYFTSALTSTDDDPIDINCSSIRPAVLHAVLPTAQGLTLFSRNQQFMLFSDSGILTPGSAIIRGISNYEMDPTIDPVDVGTVINFVSKTPSYTRIFGMQTRGSEESPMVMDIGKVVSEWVPDTVNNLVASPQNSLIALYGDNSSPYVGDKNIYIFKTYNVGDKIIMQAWVQWNLPGNIQFVSIDSDTMWSVVEDDGKYHLVSASLTQTPEETIMTTSSGQQINPHMDMYTAATNGASQTITGGSVAAESINGNDITNITINDYSMIGNYSGPGATIYPNALNQNPKVDWDFKTSTFQAGVTVDSYSILLEDLSAEDPAGSGKPYVHWDVTGIADTATGIPADASSISGATINPNYLGTPIDPGVSAVGYSGPQPPSGENHIYRLSVTANLSGTTTPTLTQSIEFNFDTTHTVSSTIFDTEAPDNLTMLAEKKVVYDTAGDFSKCYIPYGDLIDLNPVILIAGNATQNFAGVTEYGFTVNPTRATDSDGTYFKVEGKDLSSQAANVYVGYQYNYDVELPKTYFRLGQEGTQHDYTANLTIARMKFAVGLSSVVGFKVKSKGYRGPLAEFTGDSTDGSNGTDAFTVPFPLKEENGITVKVDGAKQASTTYDVTTTDDQATVTFKPTYVPLAASTAANVTTPAQKIEITTDTWYDVHTAQELGQYLADDVPLTDSSVFTVPIHQRSDNFNIRVFSNSPFPVALTSMMWEGQYSPRFYRRT